MSTAALATRQQATADIVESVIVAGDLARLSPAERVNYYRATCESLGLNPLTRPFEYINLNGKLTLYARKDATDQLRSIKGISIDKPDIRFEEDWIIVTVAARDATGRTDADLGVVSRKDMRGDFGNALMKAVTKAKRRVTLSICGLGMLDETEIETIPTARPVVVADTGEVVTVPTNGHGKTLDNPTPPAQAEYAAAAKPKPDVLDADATFKELISATEERAQAEQGTTWHWVEDEASNKRYHKRLTELQLNHDEANKALGVTTLRNYPGTVDEALKALQQYRLSHKA